MTRWMTSGRSPRVAMIEAVEWRMSWKRKPHEGVRSKWSKSSSVVALVCGIVALACAPIATPRAEQPAAAVATAQAPTAPVADGAHIDRPSRPMVADLAGGRPVLQLARTEAYAELAATLARASSPTAFNGRLANWPITGRITSPFGPRWGGFHDGIDIAAAMYMPVRAAAAGQVVTAGKPYLAYGDTGTIVIIAHGDDFATVYVHLSDDRPPAVKVGQRVTAGEVIAYNGSTGWSTGPHVHFMTIVSGRAVDPIPYLP